jgi:hypothetical protein
MGIIFAAVRYYLSLTSISCVRRYTIVLLDWQTLYFQMTEQLLAGASSAAEAATQLEEVIKQLRQVVGQ